MNGARPVLGGLDLLLGGLFLAGWVSSALFRWFAPYPGTVDLDLYRLYALAGVLGWVFGNVYIRRSGRLPPPYRAGFRLFYFLGPAGLIFLARALAPLERVTQAPFAPVYAFGVYAVLFGVPVLLRPKVR